MAKDKGRRDGSGEKGRGSERRHPGPRAPSPLVEHWKLEPDGHDYPAAEDFLSLLVHPERAAEVVKALRDAPLVRRKAKDLLRSSRLPLLPADDFHVDSDLAKVRRGEMLSPVLVVRGDLGSDVPLTIADGYHRVCASYHLDEDADIPCRIVDGPGPG
jgi:hypothetical protein